MQSVDIDQHELILLAPGGHVGPPTGNDPKNILKDYPLVKAFLAGSFSGTFSTILFQPLDLVKTRLQNPTALLNGRHGESRMVTVFANILQQDHIRGLWKGMTPSITRCVPGVGLYFCSLDFLKGHFVAPGAIPSPLASVALGMVARCMSGVTLIPITVVKTRYESGVYGYHSVPAALREIYRSEGVRGLTCGLVPTLFRDAPFSGLYLMFYTQSKLLVPRELLESSMGSPMHFSCGVLAGVLASAVTQPADVLKTKMQLYPSRFKGIWSVVVYVHGEYGLKGYFKGMVPRMLRRTLMSAMAWTVYEKLSQTVGLK